MSRPYITLKCGHFNGEAHVLVYGVTRFPFSIPLSSAEAVGDALKAYTAQLKDGENPNKSMEFPHVLMPATNQRGIAGKLVRSSRPPDDMDAPPEEDDEDGLGDAGCEGYEAERSNS